VALGLLADEGRVTRKGLEFALCWTIRPSGPAAAAPARRGPLMVRGGADQVPLTAVDPRLVIVGSQPSMTLPGWAKLSLSVA
jgi:hypothetical protein